MCWWTFARFLGGGWRNVREVEPSPTEYIERFCGSDSRGDNEFKLKILPLPVRRGEHRKGDVGSPEKVMWAHHSVEYEGFGTTTFSGNVTKFAPDNCLKLNAYGQVDF
jgi:hypothetical protein